MCGSGSELDDRGSDGEVGAYLFPDEWVAQK